MQCYIEENKFLKVIKIGIELKSFVLYERKERGRAGTKAVSILEKVKIVGCRRIYFLINLLSTAASLSLCVIIVVACNNQQSQTTIAPLQTLNK